MAFAAGKCHLAEYGKQQATLSISHAQKRARSCFAMARKSAMKWNSFARTTSRKRVQGEALLLVVKVVQVVFPCVHVDSAGNVSKAKRCSLLFPLQQPLVCMGLEEAMSWRSVVTCCKSCSSCFPMCPRRFSRKRVQGEALFIVVSLAATLGLHGPRRGDILAKRCSLL